MQEQIEAVQRMQDYIEANLKNNISLGDLATASLFSPWYSARLFKEFTGFTPGDYIRRLKLSKSALRLRDDACRIIEVAFEMGFGSVDGYQRAFYREFGCNPREYAKHPVPIYLFTPYRVEGKAVKKELREVEKTSNIFIQVINKPSRKVIIKRGIKAEEYFEYCHEVGCDVWGLLTSIKSISGEPVCLWLPDKYRRANTSKYVQGVEVPLDYSGEIPEGFEIIELPEATYLMFQGEPFEEENYGEAIEAVQKAMDKYDPSFIGYSFDIDNPRIQLEPIGKRGYIEMMAVKEL